VVELERLKLRLDEAKMQVDFLLREEKEAADRFAKDPAVFDDWQDAITAVTRARLEFEAAQAAWLEAKRASLA
jgi:hypothetical protein